MRRAGAVLLIILGVVITLLFAVVAIAQWKEREAVAARVVRVEATLLRASHRQWRSGKNTRCETVFHFEYAYDGSTNVATNLGQTGLGNDCNRAGRLVAAAPPGTRIAAYHDPIDPQKSFAFGNPATGVYYVVPVCGLVLIALATLVAGAGGAQAPWRTPTRAGQWHRLRSRYSTRLRSRAFGAAALWWVGSCAVAFLSWRSALLDHRPAWFDGIVAFAAGGVLIIVAIVVAARSRTFDEPEVTVDVHPLVRGRPVNVRIVQRIKRAARLHKFTLDLQCIRGSGKHAHTIASARLDDPLDTDVSGGTTIERTLALEVPEFTNIGETLEAPKGRRQQWYLIVRLDGPGLIDQVNRYLVETTGGSFSP